MRYVLTNRGYTLVDAIIQLVVLLLFSQLLMFYYVWFNQIENNFVLTEEIEWEMFALDMESYLSSVTTLEEQEDRTGIRFTKDGQEFDIECSSTVIRKQKFRLGHEIMLTGIKLCKLEVLQDQVVVQVEFSNGGKEVRTFEVFVSTQ
ncbi:competence type IV pilus minor pilin ComGF [Paenisporosarcina indica]|uniref:competence type IV pilus minor pilin ComGF n=1 Tax=Paenisporosarcina indica TaxID=650093 RepID=UPI00094FC862|nr:competence type IV pilus minor pilin ComGF [Paenisporosarcina indica]